MKITIALGSDGTTKTHEAKITAYKTADSALIVHKQTWIARDGSVQQGKAWIITHKPTGLAILKGYTKRDYAIAAAAQLAALANWQDITPATAPKWYEANRAAMQAIARSVQ